MTRARIFTRRNAYILGIVFAWQAGVIFGLIFDPLLEWHVMPLWAAQKLDWLQIVCCDFFLGPYK